MFSILLHLRVSYLRFIVCGSRLGGGCGNRLAAVSLADYHSVDYYYYDSYAHFGNPERFVSAVDVYDSAHITGGDARKAAIGGAAVRTADFNDFVRTLLFLLRMASR